MQGKKLVFFLITHLKKTYKVKSTLDNTGVIPIGSAKKRMKKVLDDIQSGKFTKQWMDECKNGQKNFLKTRAKLAEHQVEKVGAGLRALMPWISKKKLIDSDKN